MANIIRILNHGIMKLDSNGNFRPKEHISREDIVDIIMNIHRDD